MLPPGAVEQALSSGGDRSPGENPGALERAAGGTLYIDNLDRTHSMTQAGLVALLRMSQLGTGRSEPNLRIMAATSPDLEAQVRTNQFYFRTNRFEYQTCSSSS